MSEHRLQRVADLHFPAAAADEILTVALGAVRARGRFLCALAGGSTPRHTYELLAASPRVAAFPWPATTLLFGDERCVRPGSERSNHRMVRETLLDRLPADRRPKVLRMEGERRDRATAAAEYEKAIRRLWGAAGTPRLDLVVLGLGTDGHTASLFPGSKALDVPDDRLVTTARNPADRTHRLTVTLPLIRAARERVFLVRGPEKMPVLEQALDPACDLPAARAGWSTWIVAE